MENKDIVIKPADKGSTTVIMDRQRYLDEGYRQLTNKDYYKPLNEPVHPTVKDKFNTILTGIHQKNKLDKKQLEYLKVKDNSRERRFYLLPKIHKEREKWTDDLKNPPGRPIVSDCDSDSYRISEYIDYFLKPISTQHPSYIKDTPDFLNKLSEIKPSKDCLLITLDVESLYTNITNKITCLAIKDAFDRNPDPERPDLDILRLLLLSLKNNDFTFNGEWFHQVSGTAMGKKFAPSYANIFMARWEEIALEKCPKQPECYFRYLDDIFIIWPHSREDFQVFLAILNSQHSKI